MCCSLRLGFKPHAQSYHPAVASPCHPHPWLLSVLTVLSSGFIHPVGPKKSQDGKNRGHGGKPGAKQASSPAGGGRGFPTFGGPPQGCVPVKERAVSCAEAWGLAAVSRGCDPLGPHVNTGGCFLLPRVPRSPAECHDAHLFFALIPSLLYWKARAGGLYKTDIPFSQFWRLGV